MLNYVTQIAPLENAGKTDAEIVSYYNVITAKPIPCSDLKIILEESGLVVEDPVTGSRVGSLIDHYTGLPAGNEKMLLGWFISHVFGRGVEVSCHVQPRAGQVDMVCAGLPVEMSAVVDAMYALGGGKPYAALTTAIVASVRNTYNAQTAEKIRKIEIEQLRAEIENNFISVALGDGVTTATDLRATIKTDL